MKLWAPSCLLWLTVSLAVVQPSSVRDQQHQQAARLRQVVSLNPRDYQIQLELATQLHSLDQQYPDGGIRVPEAEQAYRSAVKYAPSEAAAAAVLSNLGALLLSAGQLQECLQVIDECREIGVRTGYIHSLFFAGATFNKGKALGMLGRGEEAALLFTEAIEASRGVSAGTFSKAYASLQKFTPEHVSDMESALRYLQLVQAPKQQGSAKPTRRRPLLEASLAEKWSWLRDISPTDQSWLHFALFSAYQMQGAHVKAWEHLDAANKLQHAKESHSSSQDSTLLEALKTAFPATRKGKSAATLRSDPYHAIMSGQAGHDSKVPIFVVGMPRSGSTLVEQILASHSQVFGAGEDTALAPLVPELLTALHGSGSIDPTDIAAVGRKYVTRMQAKAAQRHDAVSQENRSKGKPAPPKRIVDKMLRNAWNLGHIAIMLPAAKVLHVVRHPMDVTLSCYAQPFEGRGTPWAWDLTEIAEQVVMTHEIVKHWESVLPADRIMRVPYEALITDQEAMSRRILDFVGLSWEPGVLRFHETVRSVQTASLGQVRQKLYTSAVGKWKRYEAQLQPALDILQPLVKQYEVEIEGLLRLHRPSDEL